MRLRACAARRAPVHFAEERRIMKVVVLCCATLFTVPCAGQSAAPVVTPQAAFESFLRVAEFTGRPNKALTARWPALLPRAGGERLFLTAAHHLSVSVANLRSGPDSSVVEQVALLEYVPDTIALGTRIREVMQVLQAVHGEPDLCSSPLGPPGYFFAVQTVARSWRSGIGNQHTRVEWWRTADARFGITVEVSATAVGDSDLLPCNAKLP